MRLLAQPALLTSLALALLLCACGDPDDQGPSAPVDPCRRVDCGLGMCLVVNDAPRCQCDEGAMLSGLRCVPIPNPPVLENLPAQSIGGVGDAGQFEAIASDPDGDAITFELNTLGCEFEVRVDQAGLVSWTCPATSAECEIMVRVADAGGARAQAPLTIECVNTAPYYMSAAPAAAQEGVELRYKIVCEDPDGAPVALAVASADTCGGVIEGDTYVLTPSEEQGDASCELAVVCSDGELSVTQAATLAVEEINAPPAVSDVVISPAFIIEPGQPLTCTYSFSDAEGAADASLIEWLVNGIKQGEGVTFDDYGAGDEVSCEVSPYDGAVTGQQVSASIYAPHPAPLAAGSFHSCAARGGALKCWGSNASGQLGVSAGFGDFTGNVTPQTVFGQDVLAASAGFAHTCAIHQDALKCWGDNSSGQLGAALNLGSGDGVPAPQTVLTGDVRAVGAGFAHTCAIQAGALYCWGDNQLGQLGVATITGEPYAPQRVFDSGVTAVSVGSVHTCAIHQGALKCWGDNSSGQLGVTTATPQSAAPQTVFADQVSIVAAGESHTCASYQGQLYCWGNNGVGQVGAAASFGDPSAPVAPVMVLGQVSALSAGAQHTCAVVEGALRCWGYNFEGQLGAATTYAEASGTITPQTALGGDVSAVDAGASHTCALQQDQLYCWGGNQLGQVSIDANPTSYTPHAIVF